MINNNKSYLNQLLRDALYYSISKIIPGLTGLISVILFFRLIKELFSYFFLLSLETPFISWSIFEYKFSLFSEWVFSK